MTWYLWDIHQMSNFSYQAWQAPLSFPLRCLQGMSARHPLRCLAGIWKVSRLVVWHLPDVLQMSYQMSGRPPYHSLSDVCQVSARYTGLIFNIYQISFRSQLNAICLGQTSLAMIRYPADVQQTSVQIKNVYTISARRTVCPIARE